MAHRGELDRLKSTKSAKSTASDEGIMKRWNSFVKPFAAQDSCDHCGRGSCDNGFEGRWENGVPSVRSRAASQAGSELRPPVLSDVSTNERGTRHARLKSSQAMSSADGIRVVSSTSAGSSDGDGRPGSARHSESGRSQEYSFEAARGDEGYGVDELDDDDMGLAQQRRSKRYSSKSPLSPLSPTFAFGFRDRNPDERASRSVLKRDSIRLSALPPIPRSGGTRRSFPAGQGPVSFISTAPKSPELNDSFVFPQPGGPDLGMRSPSLPRTVAWNGHLDPDKPQNRPIPAKLASTLLLLGLTLTVTFASSALTPASFQISKEFSTPSEIIILASALTVLGFAFGAPVFGALSEKYGRKRPLLLGMTVFALFNIPVGLTDNLPTLLAFRFFTGVFGAAPLAVVPGALGDLWSPVGRGIAISFFAAVSIMGPVAGAIGGSYLAVVEYPGWRWTAWIGSGLAVLFGIPFAFAYKETSEAVLLQRRARQLRRMTRDWAFHAEGEESAAGAKHLAIKTVLVLAEPSLLLPTIHMSFACGVLNLMFVSYGFAFRTERLWLRGTQDLPLVPLIAGCLIGIFINFIVSKKKYTAVFRRDGFAPPEARIIPWIIGSWILPIGLLVFAWTSAPEITFISQLLAGIPSGIGISLILIGGFNYIIDTYATMPSLAVGASTFVRSAFAFAFPMFAPRMYEGLGVDWANTTLAIIAVVLVPIPIILMKLGARFRGMSRFAVKGQGMSRPLRPHIDAEMAQKDAAFSVTVQARPVATAV